MDNEDINDEFKPIIELEKYHVGFIAPYDGFLYVQAEDFELQYGEYKISVKKDLNRFYIDYGVLTFINNPKNLKSVKFLKIDDAPKPKKYVTDFSNDFEIDNWLNDLKEKLNKLK